MNAGNVNFPRICKYFVLFLSLPFILIACSTEQKVSQNNFASQVRPWRGNAEAHYQLACHYQDRSRHREAIEEFQKMIAINPSDVRAYNGIGISCDALKDFPRAFLAYEKALMLNPKAGYIYNNLGYSYVLQKRHNEAVLSFRKAVEFTADVNMQKKIDNNLKMAVAFSEKPHLASTSQQQNVPDTFPVDTIAQSSSFDQDRHIRTLMIQRNPLTLRSPSPAPTTASATSVSSSKDKIAIEVANGNGVRYMARNVGEYLKKRGYNVVKLTNANSYSYQKGNVSYRADGQAIAQEIAAIFPSNVDVKKLKDGTKSVVRVRVLVGKDLIPYKKGLYGGPRMIKDKILFLLSIVAISGFSGCATSNDPQKAMMKEMARHQELAQQKATADIETQEAMAKKIPEMKADGYEREGDNYIRQGNMDMAFMQYEKAQKLDPDSNGIRYKLGWLLLNRGLNSEALKNFEEIQRREPDNALAYEGIGRVNIAMKDYDKAVKNLEKALQLKPDFWQCHALFAYLYDRQGRYDDAIASYQKAIAIKSDAFLLYNNLGMSYYMKGDYEKSVEAYIHALKINEKSPAATYNNLGIALSKLGRYNDAMNVFRRAGDEASAYNNMGMVYMADKKYSEALDSFEKAIELKPSFYVKAHENIARAKAAMKSVSVTP